MLNTFPFRETNDSSYIALPTTRTRKFVFPIVFGAVIPFLLITVLLIDYFQRAYKEDVKTLLFELVVSHAETIDDYLKGNVNDLKLMSYSHTIEQLGDSVFLQNELMLRKLKFGAPFLELGLVDEKGVLIAYAGPFKSDKSDISQEAWFQEAIKKDYFISDALKEPNGITRFIISVRIKSNDKVFLLESSIEADALTNRVNRLHIGSTGMSVIFNKNATLQTTPRFPIAQNREDCKRRLLEKIKKLNENKLYEDIFFGRKCVFVMAQLKTVDWVLIFQQDAKEVYSKPYHFDSLAIIFSLVAVIVFSLTFLLTKKVTRQLLELLKAVYTEKEAINEQFLRASKLSSIGELAAGVAHEINNPVAIMIEEAGWVEDLLAEEDKDAVKNIGEISGSLKRINTQGKRCKEITHQLLSFARKTDSMVESLRLNDLVKEIVSLSIQHAQYKNVRIETKLDPFLPSIKVSQSELQQVLLNLINNAFDAMDPTGGTISITTKKDPDYVIMEVADTGSGISMADIPKLFDPFFTTKPVGKGTGLGLSICYGIVKKKGGEIKVESEVGVGATFSVYLPRNKMRKTDGEDHVEDVS